MNIRIFNPFNKLYLRITNADTHAFRIAASGSELKVIKPKGLTKYYYLDGLHTGRTEKPDSRLKALISGIFDDVRSVQKRR